MAHGDRARSALLARPSAGRAGGSRDAASSPTRLVIGGGQGGIALGARLKRLGVPTLIVIDKHERPGDQWRKRYRSLHLHDPGLVRPHALPALPRSLAGLRRQGQDRRLAGNVRQGDGAELLVQDRMPRGPLRRGGPANGRSTCVRDGEPITLRSRSSSCSPPACRPSPIFPTIRAWTASEARAITRAVTRAASVIATSVCRGDRLEQFCP